jgi:hypothetical protein
MGGGRCVVAVVVLDKQVWDKKYGIIEPRQQLYEACDMWVEAVGANLFLGQSEAPTIAVSITFFSPVGLLDYLCRVSCLAQSHLVLNPSTHTPRIFIVFKLLSAVMYRQLLLKSESIFRCRLVAQLATFRISPSLGCFDQSKGALNVKLRICELFTANVI